MISELIRFRRNTRTMKNGLIRICLGSKEGNGEGSDCEDSHVRGNSINNPEIREGGLGVAEEPSCVPGSYIWRFHQREMVMGELAGPARARGEVTNPTSECDTTYLIPTAPL